MEVSNLITLNDLKIKKFISVIVSINLTLLSLVFLNEIGIEISILRKIVGFVFLTFIPGITILRFLRFHKLGTLKTFVFSIGLSLAFISFLGIILNFLFPYFNMSFNQINITIIICVVVLIITFLTIYVDKNYIGSENNNLNINLSHNIFLFCLLPFISILGAVLVNNYKENLFFIILFILISLIVFLVSFKKLPKTYYPFGILMISISLLYQFSLISLYLTGVDIHFEYYLSNMTIKSGLWNFNYESLYSGSVVIGLIAPIYSIICNININWVYKLIVPFLTAMIPLTLYKIYEEQTNSKIAFFAAFLFLSFFSFHTELLTIVRQQIAELFLVLLLMVLMEKELDIKYTSLLIIFTTSLVISHYSMSYLAMFFFASAFFYSYLKRIIRFRSINLKAKSNRLTLTFILFFSILSISWYIYTSESKAFISLIRIFEQISGSIYVDFLNPTAAQGYNLIIYEQQTLTRFIGKFIQLLVPIFITLGLLSLEFKETEYELNPMYKDIAIFAYLLLVLSIVIPYLASSLNTTRIFQIALIFLAPYAIIGILTVCSLFNKICIKLIKRSFIIRPYKIISVFLVIFFLFNVGFIYEISNDPSSISLSQKTIEQSNDIQIKGGFFTTLSIFDQDVNSSNWLIKNRNYSKDIYSDRISSKVLKHNLDKTYLFREYNNTLIKPKNSYLFLGYVNLRKDVITMEMGNIFIYKNTVNELKYIESTNKIYSNGAGDLYYN